MYLRDIFSFIVLSGLITVSAAADAKFSINTSTIRVIDAGTISANQKVFKLQGIIAPSAKQKCKIRALPWLCGAAARSFLVDIFEENNVAVVVDQGNILGIINKIDLLEFLSKKTYMSNEMGPGPN